MGAAPVDAAARDVPGLDVARDRASIRAGTACSTSSSASRARSACASSTAATAHARALDAAVGGGSPGRRAQRAGHVSAGAGQRRHGERLRQPGHDRRRRVVRLSRARSTTRSGARSAASRSPTSRRSGPARGWHERALASLLDGVERRTALAELLLRREPWDALMVVFGESDTVAHHFWRFHDRASPRRAASPHADAIRACLPRAR